MTRGLLQTVAMALVLAGWATPGRAEEANACTSFKWPLAREQQLFAGGPAHVTAQGAFPLAAAAARVDLQAVNGLTFAVPPERKPVAGSFAALLQLDPAPAAGLYQVTLSAEAWIDVVQDGKPVKSGAFSGKEGCPSLRKSVRFALEAKPTLLQISNAKASTIDIAILQAQ